MVKLGTKTPWGNVAGVHYKDGERYYFLVAKGLVSYMPADVIEGWVHDCGGVAQG